MKKSTDPRHLTRKKIIKDLFAYSFVKQPLNNQKTENILKMSKRIDKIISKYAPEWPVDKLNKIDLAILRLSVYELLNGKEPLKVIIDEAVELAKEFGSESSPAFVNGVLGAVVKNRKIIKST